MADTQFMVHLAGLEGVGLGFMVVVVAADTLVVVVGPIIIREVAVGRTVRRP